MIRCRFRTTADDPRPADWPIKHPYWITGEGEGYSILVAYADDEAEILKNWPEAFDLDSEPATEYMFTGRFPKPEWFGAEQPGDQTPDELEPLHLTFEEAVILLGERGMTFHRGPDGPTLRGRGADERTLAEEWPEAVSRAIGRRVTKRDDTAKLKTEAERLDRALDQEIATRDRLEDLLDDFTHATAAVTSEDYGEHSNANDPWTNALKDLKALAPRAPKGQQVRPEISRELLDQWAAIEPGRCRWHDMAGMHRIATHDDHRFINTQYPDDRFQNGHLLIAVAEAIEARGWTWALEARPNPANEHGWAYHATVRADHGTFTVPANERASALLTSHLEALATEEGRAP